VDLNRWNLEGEKVLGLYLDYVPVIGEVVESRVTYGGGVAHTVKLDIGFTTTPGGPRREAGEEVILDHGKNFIEILKEFGVKKYTKKGE